MFDLRRRSGTWPAIVSLACLPALLTGCASPAAPRPPSLGLPETVRDLSAVRSGDEVQLRFTVPRRTTDGGAITQPTLHGSLCRQEAPGAPCRPVYLSDSDATLEVAPGSAQPTAVLWTDTLPPQLRQGAPRPLAYRITLRNANGRSAGPSEPVYTAAGQAPAPVEHFTAEAVRLGILLRWTADPGDGEVLLERVQIDPKPAPAKPRPSAPMPGNKHARSRSPAVPPRTGKPAPDPGVVWLEAETAGPRADATVDRSPSEAVRYSYTALRQITAKVGGRTLALRSLPSPPAAVTWRDIYPPPAPLELTAVGYVTGTNGVAGWPTPQPAAGYAVDLIWQPVNDPRVTGYLVTRQPLDPAGNTAGSPERLTPSPVTTTGFHDPTAQPAKSYRYTVVATDAKGNLSAAATTAVPPQSR